MAIENMQGKVSMTGMVNSKPPKIEIQSPVLIPSSVSQFLRSACLLKVALPLEELKSFNQRTQQMTPVESSIPKKCFSSFFMW